LLPFSLLEKPDQKIPVLQSLTEIEKAIEKKDKPVILDFYADWCISCKNLEKKIIMDQQIQQVLRDFKLYRIDITANSLSAQAIMKKFSVIAPPTFVFFNRNGEELPEFKLIGEFEPESFLSNLTKIKQIPANIKIEN
jgi:thioredoxin:protein disulfide reductase